MQGFNREHSLQQRSLFPPSNLSFSSFPPAFTKAEGQDMEQGMGRSRQRASDLSGEADRQRGSKDHNKDRNKNRTVLRPSQSVTGKLTGEDRQLAGNRFSDEYRLKGLRSGSELQISLRTNRFRPDLQLLDARTRRVILDSNAADNMRSLLTFQAQPRREYVLRVTSDAPRKTGRYQLKLDLIGKKVNLQPIVSPGGDAPGTVIDPGQQRGERTESARSLPFNSRYGYGIVDAEAAVLRSLGRTDSTEVANLGGNLWGLDMVRAPEVWAKGFTGKGVTIAVLDGGVDYTHPDLQDNIWTNSGEISGNGIDDDRNGYTDDVYGWNFYGSGRDTNDVRDYSEQGHGTHIAGIIAAKNDGYGITGVAPDAKIMSVRVAHPEIDVNLDRFDANLAAGIRYAVDNGANVLSMSLGNFVGEPTLTRTKAALQYARQKGAIAVMASGNERLEGADRPIDPARFALDDLGIGVGAVNQRRKVADFSNPAGNQPLDFVVAPGVGITSTVPLEFGGYRSLTGTSMSTPYVAGVAALMLSANPNLTPGEVENILVATANRQGITT
jgi:subtilisin